MNGRDKFGSMHIIKSGDFHQFPPVTNPTGALYVDRPDKDSKHALIGREIFLQFDKVVILDKQNRIRDDVWANILSRLRVGECDQNDLEEIRKLVLTVDISCCCSQLGACHLLFVRVDTLGASLVPPFFPSYRRFLTLYHHQYMLVVPPSLCLRPVFQHLPTLSAMSQISRKLHGMKRYWLHPGTVSETYGMKRR